jgi:CRP-like cAMP-binding protein
MSLKEVEKGHFLYSKGEASLNFYFILKGKMELVVDSAEGFKLSKNVDEAEFFGQKSSQTEVRLEYARGVSDKT